MNTDVNDDEFDKQADHKLISGIFSDYESTISVAKEKRVVNKKTGQELPAHAQADEEIFYPEMKAAFKEHELILEAGLKHTTLKAVLPSSALHE